MKKIILILLITLSIGVIKAQEEVELKAPARMPSNIDSQLYSAKAGVKQYYTIAWSIGFPTSDFGGHANVTPYISNTSCAGGLLSGQAFVLDNKLGLGASIGWNNFYQSNPRATYEGVNGDKGMAITGASYAYMSTTPIKFLVSYAFAPNSPIFNPYFTLGLGANYMTQHLMFQDIDIWTDNWGFVVSPEIGTYIRFGKNAMWGANIGFGYNYCTNQFRLTDNINANNIQYLNLNIGLTIMVN